MTTMGVTAMSGFGILLAALAATTILRKRSASLRHLVWTVALGLVVAVPAFHTSGLSVEIHVPGTWLPESAVEVATPTASVGEATAQSPAVESAPIAERSEVGSGVGAGVGSGEGSGVGSAAGTIGRSGTAARASASGLGRGARSGVRGGGEATLARGSSNEAGDRVASTGGASEASMAGSGASDVAQTRTASSENASATSGTGPGLGEIALAIWLLGSIVLATSMIFSHLAARRLVSAGVERASPRAARRFAALCLEIGIRRPVRLVVNPRIRVPATWGLRRATVVLPPQYEQWPEETLDRVLLHELAHVQRGDCRAALLGECARALHWPNPLAWIALSRQRTESEHACDDLVLQAGEAASDYAHDLLRLVRAFSTSARLPEASLAMARPSGLGRRVRAVLDPAQRRGSTGRPVVVASGTIALLCAFGATAVVPVARAQEEQVRPPAPEPIEAPEPIAPPTPSAPDVDVFGLPIEAPQPEPVRDAPWVVDAPWPVDAPRPVDAPSPTRLDPSALIARPPGFFPFAALPVIDQSQEPCVFRGEGKRSTSINSDRERMTMRWETDGCSVDIDIRGDVVFSDDDTDIVRMDRGARFDLEETIGRTSRRVRLDGTSSGIDRRYWVDRDEVDWNAEADAWLARMLPELFRHTTINAEARVRRIVARGGSAALFQEVEQIHSDHVRSRYLELLMRESRLSDEEYTRIIDYAGQLDSDHTSGELLLAVVETAGMRPAFERPMLRAAEGLESDHQRTRVLTTLLEAGLGPSQLDAVVLSAASIESDHNLADILSTVAATGRLSDVGRETFLEALGSIESDHNQARVLEAFLDAGRVSDDEVTRILEMTTGIESDHQRASILQRVAADFTLSGDQISAYLASAAALESDHQVATTAEMIVDRSDFTREHLALVLTMTDRIDSDHQRATVLERVVLRQNLSDREVQEALMVAAGIDSDHQLGSILTLILEDETLSADALTSLLETTRRLDSSRERSSVLVKLAGIYDVRAEVRTMYEELAEELSRMDRRRAMDALRG